jgi:gas vesicle protein
MSQDKNKGLAAGVAVGAVLGVLAGILFAPKSGKETRKDIKDSAIKIAAKLQEEAKKIQIELGELIDVAESKAKNAGKSVSAKTHELIDHAKQTRDTLVELASSVKAGEADDQDLNDAIKKANEAKEALKVYLKK